MIGQLQNNFRKYLTNAAFCTLLLAPYSHAETVSGTFIFSDWYVLVKEENGLQTVVTTETMDIRRLEAKPISFDIDEEAPGQNHIYIIVGSRRMDGLEPFFAGSLQASKTVLTDHSDYSVFKSNYTDVNPPNNALQIKEIIEGGMGGGTFGPTFPLTLGERMKSLGGSLAPGIWTHRNVDDGKAVVFRLPYSALIAPSHPPPPPPPDENMVDYIEGLKEFIEELEDDKRELEANLDKETRRADSTFSLLEQRDKTIAALSANPSATTTLSLLEEQKDEIVLLKAKVKDLEDDKISQTALVSGGLGLLGLGGLLGWLSTRWRRRQKKYEIGYLMPGSSIVAGPLPPTLAHCKAVYDAVGRVGKAQKGKPTGDEDTFGTGILIAPNKVLTNHHVFHENSQLGHDPEFGIEFYAELDSDKTDFVPFDTTIAPIPIEGHDAVIFTLKNDVTERTPISIIDEAAKDLKEREVVVIGYPYVYFITTEIENATEETDPIMGVKRYSEGTIFNHPKVRNNPYGVDAPVKNYIHPSGHIRAICHNASTLGGSSGSAVVCKKTGQLVALHFGYDPSFGGTDATNFAIPGEDIAQAISDNIPKTVTPITDDNAPIIHIST